jgi:hypothetical protein
MAAHYDQLKRMMEKVERLKERARTAHDPRIAEKHLRRADVMLASVQAIKDNRKEFGERARGNTNFKGARHSREAREKMSLARKEFWQSNAGFQKMWRARRRRQYREKGKCLIRFPRIPASVDKDWLKACRKRYRTVIGENPDIRLYD